MVDSHQESPPNQVRRLSRKSIDGLLSFPKVGIHGWNSVLDRVFLDTRECLVNALETVCLQQLLLLYHLSLDNVCPEAMNLVRLSSFEFDDPEDMINFEEPLRDIDDAVAVWKPFCRSDVFHLDACPSFRELQTTRAVKDNLLWFLA